jgi:hypothetical protein
VVGSEVRMRIEVTDGRADMGVVDGESRGLVVVAHLATDWGVSPSTVSGKVVWAELPWRASGPDSTERRPR